MSIEKMKTHYAMTSPASVYDEEALTALELAGRTACKVNEVVDLTNKTEARTESMVERLETVERDMPVMAREAAEKQVDAYVKDGTFDAAISEYAGDLEKRLDNFMAQTPNGSTTMDAEIIDARVGGNGKTYDNLGDATRDQYTEVNDATNDRVSARAMEYGYKHDFNRPSMWRQGWIDTATGEDGDTGTDVDMYIRTADFVPTTVERVEVVGGDKGLRLSVYRYDLSGKFVNMEEYRRAAYKFDHTSYKYRLAATGGVDQLSAVYLDRKMPVTLADATSVLMLGDPDKTVNPSVDADAVAHGYKRNQNARYMWEQGYLFGTTGEEGTSPAGADYWAYARSSRITEGECVMYVCEGYKARVFPYLSNGSMFGTVVEVAGGTTRKITPIAGMLHYRVDVTPVEKSIDTRAYVGDLWDKVLFMTDPVTEPSLGGKSAYLADVVYDPVPSEWYAAVSGIQPQNDLDAVSVDLIYDEFSKWDGELRFSQESVGAYNDGGSVLNIYAFRHKPKTIEGDVIENFPKIIIVGGQHGFEKGNVVGLTNFWNELLNYGIRDNAALNYLRDHVEIIVIPILNVWGFENSSYKNHNGVNLNRNYDYNWTAVADNTSDQYGGLAPFDQPETAFLRDFIRAEAADGRLALVIDSHSKGQSVVTSTRDMNWIVCCNETDEGYARLRHVCRAHLAAQNGVWYKFDGSVGYYNGFNGGGNTVASLDNWLTYNEKIISLTLEGCNGVFAGSLFDDDTEKFNTELIGNFLLHFCREYAKGV